MDREGGKTRRVLCICVSERAREKSNAKERERTREKWLEGKEEKDQGEERDGKRSALARACARVIVCNCRCVRER